MIISIRRRLLETFFREVQQNHLQQTQEMLDNHPMLVFKKDKLGDTALMWAAAMGLKDMVYLLLEREAPIGVCNLNGDTAIHCAARKQHFEIALALLQRCPSIQYQANYQEQTPLFWFPTPQSSATLLPFKRK